jgi:hypothetical protein
MIFYLKSSRFVSESKGFTSNITEDFAITGALTFFLPFSFAAAAAFLAASPSSSSSPNKSSTSTSSFFSAFGASTLAH